MANINFFALGGQDENGKNSYVLEIENESFVIDCGVKHPVVNALGVDTIIPNFTYLEQHIKKIKGLFITHGHDESFAALPWLLMNVTNLKIYASKFTIAIIKERIEKYKIGHKNYELVEINKPLQIGRTLVKPIPLAHSIPGTIGFDFHTPDGSVLFMSNYLVGDLKQFGTTDLAAIQASASPKGVLALMVDASMSAHQGKTIEKAAVTNLLRPHFTKWPQKQRIIIGAYDEEMFSLQNVLDLAIEMKRPIITYGRVYAHLLNLLIKDHPKMKLPQIIDYRFAEKTQNAIILVTGTRERLYQRFVRIAENNDIFLKLKATDLVLMMAPPINGLEANYQTITDIIAKKSPNIYDIEATDFYRPNPAKEDLKLTIEMLRPQYLLPISALYRYLVVAAREAHQAGMKNNHIIVLQNGKIAYFKDGLLASQNGKHKNVGDVIIDGFGIGDLSYEVIREREKLSTDGVIAISSLFNMRAKKIIEPINVNFVGVLELSTAKELAEKIKSWVLQIVHETEEWNHFEVQNRIRRKVMKLASKTINKEPMVVITFYPV